MKLFEAEKVPLFCDGFRPQMERRKKNDNKLVDVTLRIQPLTRELAASVAGDGLIKKSLFNLSDGSVLPNLQSIQFKVDVPRQQLHVFSAPDVERASLMFDQVDISKLRARIEKSVNGWGLIFHATFGPVGRQELEALQAWYTTQRFVTFQEAEPSLEFEEDEGTDADQKAEQPARPVPIWDDPPAQETAAEVPATKKKERANRKLHSHASKKRKKARG